MLGLTATPFRTASNEHLADIFDELLLGPSVSDLIGRGILVPPRVYGPSSPITRTHNRNKRCESRSTRGGSPTCSGGAPPLDLTAMAVRAYSRHAAGLRAVAFCARVADSHRLASALSTAGVPAAHLDGETSAAEREILLSRLASGSLKVVCNCDVLSEGFDLPSLEAVLLLRPTGSRRLYIQQVGRALRAATGKTHCVVLDLVGLTWHFGPIIGPQVLGEATNAYKWEEACGERVRARALVRRCKCGQLMHCLVRCGVCGAGGLEQAAGGSGRLAGGRVGGAGRGGGGQGNGGRAMPRRGEVLVPPPDFASTAMPVRRSKHAPATKQTIEAVTTAMATMAMAKCPPPAPPDGDDCSLEEGVAEWRPIWHERRQIYVHVHSESGEVRPE